MKHTSSLKTFCKRKYMECVDMWLFCDLGLITHSLLVTVKLLKGLGKSLIQSFWVHPELKKLYIRAVIETFWLT